MNPDRLRQDLADLAEEAISVDLRDRALATSRRLGVQRTLAMSAAAVVLLGAATGTAFAFVTPDRDTPVPPAVTPSVTVFPTPSGTPSVAPSGSMGAAPPRQLTVNEIKNGRISIPAWGDDFCPKAGAFQFSKGNHVYGSGVDSPGALGILGDPVFVDVDGDGGKEGIVLITCSPSAVNAQQVLALRHGADGGIETVGQVAAVSDTSGQVNPGMIGLGTGDPGAVRVKWAQDSGNPDGSTQWRTYRFSGGRFRQTGGPTSFPDVTLDLKPQADGVLTLAKGAEGAYWGELVVTVRNAAGDVAATQVASHVTLPAGVELVTVRSGPGETCDVWDAGPPRVMLCGLAEFGEIPAHGSRSYTFHFVYRGTATPASGKISFWSAQEERTEADNTIAYSVKLTG